jgi:hypothetical protein
MADAAPQRQNRRLAMLLVLVLAGLYTVAIWGVIVLN